MTVVQLLLFKPVVSVHDQLGKFWETIVFSMIGETLDESDEICGARILDKVSKEGDVES